MVKTEEVVIPSQAEASSVLAAMKVLLHQYEEVTLADFLELCGLTTTFEDNKVGWNNLINIEIRPVKDGYILILPNPKDL